MAPWFATRSVFSSYHDAILSHRNFAVHLFEHWRFGLKCMWSRYIFGSESNTSLLLYSCPSPVGTEYVTEMFAFLCFSSCASGPSRRPVEIIFTLEKEWVGSSVHLSVSCEFLSVRNNIRAISADSSTGNWSFSVHSYCRVLQQRCSKLRILSMSKLRADSQRFSLWPGSSIRL